MSVFRTTGPSTRAELARLVEGITAEVDELMPERPDDDGEREAEHEGRPGRSGRASSRVRRAARRDEDAVIDACGARWRMGGAVGEMRC